MEVGVQVVQRWILARLRNRRFFSLAELNGAIGELVADINARGPEPLTGEQRRDLLEIIDNRDGKGSLLMTSQVPISRWHEIIGHPTLGDAILVRSTVSGSASKLHKAVRRACLRHGEQRGFGHRYR